jgi:hypothetical protein
MLLKVSDRLGRTQLCLQYRWNGLGESSCGMKLQLVCSRCKTN